MTLWNNLSPGRMRCLFACVVLCMLLAFYGALLLGAEKAHAEQPDDSTGGGGANQLSGAAEDGAQDSGNAGGGGMHQGGSGTAGGANGGGQALGDGAGGVSNGSGNGLSGGGTQNGLDAAANGEAQGSGDSGSGGGSGGGGAPGETGGKPLATPASGGAPAPAGPAPEAAPGTTAVPASRREAAYGQAPAQAPARVYEAPVPPTTNEPPASGTEAVPPIQRAPVRQSAQPFVETAAPRAGLVAGTPEPAIEPARRAAAPVVQPVRRTLEPARGVVRPAVEPVVNGDVGPVVEPVVGTAEPVRQVAKPATEPVVRTTKPVRGIVEPVVEPAGQAIEPVGQRTVEPGIEPAVRVARLGGTPEAGYPAASRVELAVARSLEPDVAPIRERAEPEVRLTGSASPEPAAAALLVAREAAGLSPATLWDPEDPVSRVAATSSSGLSYPYGLLGRAVVAGERSAVGVASAAVGATSDRKTPQPLPFGGVPAGVGSSGGLGAGSGVGGAGLAVLVTFLFLFRVGGSLSWLSFQLPKPNSAPIIAITGRPG